MGKRVVAAMSGGVDSSVAAALLVQAGYDVIGVTMQVWPDMDPQEEARHGGCCSLGAVNDARRVADRLGIPYYVLNMRDVFQKRVIDYFVREYARGRTPNPCIACNAHIKFAALLERALALDADYVATGHYARVEREGDGRFHLYRSADPRKDQTYALYGLTQGQLARTLFPLGRLRKEETRRVAADLGLPVATKPDSQEICFVKDNDYGRFLAEQLPEVKEGPILDTAGRVIGRHRGIPFYTVGQRRGLGIASDRPLYVVAIDADRNALIVGDADEVYQPGLVAGDVNWVAFDRLEGPIEVEAKIRYNGSAHRAIVRPLAAEGADRGGVSVRFAEPQRAITPGQAVVFYRGDELLGGGTIERVLATEREPLPVGTST